MSGQADGAWRIVEDDLSGAPIRALLEQHFAGMLASSPAGSCHFLDFEGLRAGGVTFWSIHRDGELAGCGALKQLDAGHGEIKSMRTADAFLRQGVAARMLEHVVETARSRGLARLSLETGSGPTFAPALALYARHGFEECEPFADYKPDPFSHFMTRAL
ncbi:GNAT family N-acetyltransferase [Sphingopyxis macrogoltabida]|uniref:Acetyltransferase n=1 Tax=Sphingopyxis macrogoltabida TaxID=33050 RepID=A0AAC9AYG8_SPHMC|nr:GNAT family N-acetyltransferase [Sphingopyxis macrogoltabida]ALJ15953.1 acetyltransferase [Sphingopyxis macrogoltabida]AMU92193.1 acetyltransferase [Sphingopyxis macrogoltabida]